EEVVRRRTAYLLEEARKRAHILEGLKIALDHLDEVIETIKKSPTVEKAKENLIKKFSLSPVQAQAILDMRLQRLTGLERKKIEEEYLSVIKEIVRLEGILSSPYQIRNIIREELEELVEKYGDERRTEIVEKGEELDEEDLIREEKMVVTVTEGGYIKRLPLSTYRIQERGGKGLKGMEAKEEDFLKTILVASTHDYLLCFTNLGRVYWLKVYKIPTAGRLSRGKAVVNLLPLKEGESPTTFLKVREFSEDKSILMVTGKGTVKKTSLIEFSRPRSTGIIALNLEEGDYLKEAKLVSEEDEIILVSKSGRAIKFVSGEVRNMGRNAQGVKGMSLAKDDAIAGVVIVKEGESLFLATEKGYGKRTPFTLFPCHHRGGKGVIAAKLGEKTGEIISALSVKENDQIMLLTSQGMVMRISASSVREMGRNTRGVRIITLSEGDSLVDIAVFKEI
ncbi:MAG TPA: DNA gyrase subunit A, partial [bacterium]|nr:DNA gyrase subunit A [bacterium]HEX67841.1 DNA gyrase subunit A [bacterium]